MRTGNRRRLISSSRAPPPRSLLVPLFAGCKVQLLDLPGIIEGAAQGKGRGREVIAVAKTSDLVMMVLDGGKEQVRGTRGDDGARRGPGTGEGDRGG